MVMPSWPTIATIAKPSAHSTIALRRRADAAPGVAATSAGVSRCRLIAAMARMATKSASFASSQRPYAESTSSPGVATI